jgi:hypothetical protein
MNGVCNLDAGALEKALEAEDGALEGVQDAITAEAATEVDNDCKSNGSAANVNEPVAVRQGTKETSASKTVDQVPAETYSPSASDNPIATEEPQLTPTSLWRYRLRRTRARERNMDAEQPTWKKALSATKSRLTSELNKRLHGDEASGTGSRAEANEDGGEEMLFAGLVEQFYSTELGQRLGSASDGSEARMKRETFRITNLLKRSRFRTF